MTRGAYNARMETIYLTRDQTRRVDQLAVDEYGMLGLVLMENAGRGCVDVMERVGVGGPVIILCGKGNNAGDGFVIARHLDLRGHAVRVVLTAPPEKLTPDGRTNLQILRKSDAELIDTNEWTDEQRFSALDGPAGGADWVVDAVLGTGATGAPRPPYDALVEWFNAQPGKKLAVDVPTGLDCDTGQPAQPCVRADHTCTFVSQKVGYREASAQERLGEVHVVDIGAPRNIINRALS